MTGWVIVGYLSRYLFTDVKKAKENSENALKISYEVKNSQALTDERIKHLSEGISDIKHSIERITDSIDRNNEKLIDELKKEIRDKK